MLVVQGDPGLPAQVEQGAERVDIRCSGNQDCEESTEDEPKVEFVVTEGEHWNPNVREDEVLKKKVEQLKKLASSQLWLFREVVEGVVGLEDAAE